MSKSKLSFIVITVIITVIINLICIVFQKKIKLKESDKHKNLLECAEMVIRRSVDRRVDGFNFKKDRS